MTLTTRVLVNMLLDKSGETATKKTIADLFHFVEMTEGGEGERKRGRTYARISEFEKRKRKENFVR